MPAGTPKVTLFGGKTIVPGGSTTFNSPGTFTVPTGITKVSITGKGGSGNPGNAGNPAPACRAWGGSGGGGGAVIRRFEGGCLCGYQEIEMPGGPGGAIVPAPLAGGNNNNSVNSPLYANPGSTGPSVPGGNPGNPGTSGNPSTGLSYTFPGGSAGNGGAGGTGGSGGNGGGGGAAFKYSLYLDPGFPVYVRLGCCFSGPGGAGGNGGGSGRTVNRGFGGGGAGISNSGQDGNALPNNPLNQRAAGGTPGPGGLGGTSLGGCGAPVNVRGVGGGGGGGGGTPGCPYRGPFPYNCFAGGGGGGGRGNVGNPGSPGNAGASASPSTTNCITVTPGGSYPIAVGSPGGQVVISWNPQ